MRKIMILILTGCDEFYMSQYLRIKAHYEKIIKQYNLPMTVVGYVGDADNDFLEYDTNIIRMTCSDRDVGTKFLKVNELIRCNKGLDEFDIIIKTNTSTFLNLISLNALIQDDRFNPNAIYGPSSFIKHYMDETKKEYIVYPQGYFTIYSPSMMKTLLSYWDEAINYFKLKDLYKVSEDLNGWFGYGDDTLLGGCIKKYQDAGNTISLRNIWQELEFVLFNRFGGDWTCNINDFESLKKLQHVTSLIICKMEMTTSKAAREDNEPYLIDIAAFLMRQPIDQEDINAFVNNNVSGQDFNTRLICFYKSNKSNK